MARVVVFADTIALPSMRSVFLRLAHLLDRRPYAANAVVVRWSDVHEHGDELMKPQQYAKAIIGAVVAALTALAGYLVPGSKAAAGVTIALAFLAALGAVFITPNAAPAAPAAPGPPPATVQPGYQPDTQASDQAAKAARLAHAKQTIAAAAMNGTGDLAVFRNDMHDIARRAAFPAVVPPPV